VVRARDADELLQRHPPFTNEAELHNACRRELAVLADARDQEPIAAAAPAMSVAS
jgi:hypothetical protein